MAAEITCVCGKRHKVGNDDGGRQFHCQNCQSIITVPNPAVSPVPPITTVSSSAPPAETTVPPPMIPPPATSDPQWFYAKNGQATGPVAQSALGVLIRSGQLQPTDLAWQEGDAASRSLFSIPVFMPLFGKVPAGINSGTGKSRVAAGVMALLLGTLGIHNFYLGHIEKGVTQLLISIVGSFLVIGPLVTMVWAIIEGINILTGKVNSDAKGNPLI